MSREFTDDLCSIADLSDRFECLHVLGEGSYGRVFQARSRDTGEVVAIKRLILEDDVVDGVPPHIIREVCLLRDFTHPNVVRLLDVIITDSVNYSLVFEYVDQDLFCLTNAHRQRGQFLSKRKLLRYTHDLLSGVQACHTRQIVHRDLKPGNILVCARGLKICDFGLARQCDQGIQPYTGGVVTLWYRAPEILLGDTKYGKQVDIWAAGCCIAEMATLAPLFKGNSEIGTIFEIFHLLGTPTEDSWPGVGELPSWKTSFPQWPPTRLESLAQVRPDLSEHTEVGSHFMDLLLGLLCVDPKGRIPARKAARHPLFNGLGPHEE